MGLVISTKPADSPFLQLSKGSGISMKGLAAVREKGRWKYIDRTGHTALNVEADFVGDFYDGLAYLCFRKCWIDMSAMFRTRYIDKTGRTVLPARFSDTGDFRNGLVRLSLEDGTIAYVNQSGKSVLTLDRRHDPGDPWAKISTSTHVQWLKRVVLHGTMATRSTTDHSGQRGSMAVRAGAYCRLGALGTDEALAVHIFDYEGPVATGHQDVIMKKMGEDWFAVR